ncbi:MAG TPA: acyltransferase family protein [Steroidobacteraceae bacterium]|nr:acyltransferase family protein [Steroidobacteraceae bacterium]
MHAARGGFVGVDVFFLISGFLITRLIVDQMQRDSFAISSFYVRRARRILPALLALLLAVYLMGLAYCLPADMVDLSKSLVAAALSASNFYFWLHSSYFDGAAISKPLIHTWSLAVEEQFYLIWPVFLVVGNRFCRRRLLSITALVSVLSLAASAVGAREFPNATFYLPLTRFWELSAGGLLALGIVPGALRPVIRNVLAAAGLALIVLSVLLIDPKMPFSGFLALPPCMGAFLVLLAGRDGDTVIGRFLSLRPIAFIGTISYSLYLWSWPITVFQRNYAFLMSGLSEPVSKLAIFGVSLLVAYVSWKFIETPFRVGAKRPSSSALIKAAVAGTATLVALGVIGWLAGGFPMRYSARELQAASHMDYDGRGAFRFGHCFLSDPMREWRLDPSCLAVSTSKPNYLLLGDSHAAHLWFGLNATFTGANFLQATAADCLPTITHNFNESSRCVQIMDDVYKDLLVRQQIDRVLLSAKWRADTLDNVPATLDWLNEHRIQVTLFGPVASYDSPVPRLLVRAMRASDPDLPQHHRDESIRVLDAQMRLLAKSRGVEYVSMIDLFCSDIYCAVADATGSPLLFDGEHFTMNGSLYAAKRLTDVGSSW